MYSGCHADGGQGYLTSRHFGNASVLNGCYAEGGTWSSLGDGTVSIGGTMQAFAGGRSFHGCQIGDPTVTKHTVYFEPAGNFFRVQTDTSPGSFAFSKETMQGDPGVTGFLQLSSGRVFRNHPVVIADEDQSAFKAGTLWLPHDILLGDDTVVNALSTTQPARVASVRGLLDGSGAVSRDPFGGSYDPASTSYLFGTLNAATSTDNSRVSSSAGASRSSTRTILSLST
jgi:hypothetical protein